MNIPVNIEEFLKRSQEFPIIDVRSPGEFEQGHIPDAYNIPLFDDEERAKVGTTYKQIGREKAIEIGYKIVNPKRKLFLEETEKIISATPLTINHQPLTILIHCWRGGMRSAGFANFLNENGYKTYTLIRGYKAYRNFVLQSFEKNANFIIIGGETGSGKTEILKKIGEAGEPIIDWENLAHHKGSAFGSLGEKPQPTQEQFENNLSYEWIKVTSPLSGGEGPGVRQRIWLEDESRAIGTCQLPNPIWEKMKSAPIIRVRVPKEERIERLMNDYGKFSKEELAHCIMKIEKRLGPQHAKHALEELEKGNLRTVAGITLTYYDKTYDYNHEKRNFKDVFFVECENSDVTTNAKKVLEFANKNLRKEYV